MQNSSRRSLRYTLIMVLAALLLPCLLVRCGHSDVRIASVWPHVDRPTDSLSARMDYLLLTGGTEAALTATLDSLRTHLSGSEAPDNGRLQFYEAETISNRNRRLKELGRLLELTKSGTSPYLYHRIVHAMHTAEPNTAESYRAFLNSLAYFRSCGDSLMTAMSYANLTAMMISLADSTAAHEYWKRADNIFTLLDLPELRVRNRINLVLIYAQSDDMDKAIAESRNLVADSSLVNDLKVRELILRNHYFFTDSIRLIEELMRLTARRPNFVHLRGLHMSMSSDWYRRNGRIDSAFKYGHLALAEYKNVHNLSFRALIMHNYAQLVKEHGSLDSAVYYLERARTVMDSVQASRDVVNVKNLDLQRRLALQELEDDQKTHRRTVGWVIALLILIICGLSAWFLLYRHHVALEKAMQQQAREKEMSQRHATAASLAAEEKESKLKKIKQYINNLSETDTLTADNIRQLSSSIAITDAASADWGSYLQLVEQINPEFLKNLKDRCSSLSPNNIQLACYIYLGMTTRQIAHLTKIRPESVHQARWRLRVKLGVSSDEALGELLNKLGKSSAE